MAHLRSSGVWGLIILITVIGKAAGAVDEWPMYHHDLQLSGYSSSSGPETNQILWIYNTNSSAILSSPAIVNKSLYIGSQDQYLYDINIVDGTLRWRYLSNGIINSSPAVVQNKVYFLTEAGTVYSLDANTGSLRWQVDINDGAWDWSSPAVYDSNVFIASSTGYVYSLKTSNGNTNWNTYIGGSPDGPLAIADGKVFLGSHASEPTLAALDVNTGEVIWQYISPYGGFVNSNGAAVSDGDGDGQLEVYFAVYVGYGQGWVVCLDEASGLYKWSTNIGQTHSTPAIHNGKLFIGSEDGSIYKLDAATGEVLCNYQTQGEVWSAPAIVNGIVYFGSLDHIFYAIDENNCELIWNYNTQQSRLMGSPAVAYGAVFTGNENGKIYAFAKSLLSIRKTDDVNDGGCVIPGNQIAYSICYDYTGDPNHPDNNELIIIDYLPAEANYQSSTNGGSYNPSNRTITWNLGPIRYITSGCVHLNVTVNSAAMPEHEIINVARAQNEYAEERTPVCPWTGGIIYVDKKATTGFNNGTSWDNAFLDFNDALTEAQFYTGEPNGCEIWVAGNTQGYKPTVEFEDYAGATFRMPEGKVIIRGHFGGKGVYETNPAQRDFSNPAYETIFDGQVGEQEWEKANYVVTCDDIGAGLVLDGFTFTGAGNAGLYINNYSDPSIIRCKFNGNGSSGIYTYQYSYPDITDCLFLENGIAGIYSYNSSWPYIRDCNFDGNNNNLYGLQGLYADMLVENCVIRRQSVNGMNFSNSHLVVSNCKIENNLDGIKCASTSFEIVDCIIQGNNNHGIWAESASVPMITNNIIRDNKHHGIHIDHCENIAIKNNWIYHNGYGYLTSDGSGIYLTNSISPPLVRNNTIIGNAPYGIYVNLGMEPCLVNDIIRQNGTNIYSVRGLQYIEASYCCIEGGFAGTGNINCDPCFVAPDTNNFHLKPVSLCIDAGDPCADYAGETDIDGEPRVTNGRADIGADEVTKADYNGDLIVNFNDFALLFCEWQEPNSNKSLDNDADVDINDLEIFCNDWLWTSDWIESYSMLEIQTGIGDRVVVAEIPEVFNEESISQYSQELSTDIFAEELSETVEGPMSDEQIQELIDWTEQLWELNPDIREMVEPNDVLRVIDSLREQIND